LSASAFWRIALWIFPDTYPYMKYGSGICLGANCLASARNCRMPGLLVSPHVAAICMTQADFSSVFAIGVGAPSCVPSLLIRNSSQAGP
jgi:hypothetical protein